MPDDFNPYAAPRADIEPVYVAQVIPEGLPPGVWRMGYLLVMTGDGVLPPRCAMTNQPMDSYDNSMIGFMGRSISIPVSQQYADSVSHHKSIARTFQIGGLLAVLAGMGLVNWAIEFRVWELAIVCGVLIVVGLPVFILGIVWQNMFVTALEIEYFTPQFLWIRGAHPLYLKELPEWPYGAWRKKINF